MWSFIQPMCATLTAVWMVSCFFVLVHSDFHGRSAKPPSGFGGFIGSIIVIVLLNAMLYGAGAYNAILP